MSTSAIPGGERAATSVTADVDLPSSERAGDGARPTGELVPRAMQIAGAWSWRIVAIVLALIPIGWLISEAKLIVIPVFVAALFAALLRPLYNRLLAWRWPKALALIATLLVLIVAVGALLALVVTQLSTGVHLDTARLQSQYRVLLDWLRDSPFHVTEEQLTLAVTEVTEWVQANVASVLSQAVSAGSSIVAFLTGSLVTLFALIFYLLDGRRIWLFLVGLFPRSARPAVDGAARRGWVSVGHYVRVQVVVALIDAIGIVVGALLLHVPFAIPLGIIVFLAAFVPFIGAVTSGGLAVLVALVYNDVWNAIIMLIVVIAVMQIESHVLQPLIMGSAVSIHPLGVLLAVSAGSIFGGIAGAVFAVPIVAAANVAIRYIAGGEWRGLPDPTKGGRPDEAGPGGAGSAEADPAGDPASPAKAGAAADADTKAEASA